MSNDRPYRSSLREEQARQTRRRIRDAARELFASEGFATTTIADIARSAGVSAATVYATFESKAGIVAAMLEALEEDARIDVGARPEEAYAGLGPREQLQAFVAMHCDLFSKGADILRAAMRAIEDPDVAALAEAGDGHRRQVIETMTAGWRRAGALRPGLTAKEAADRLWLLTTLEGYLTAVDHLGWTVRKYERWLIEVADRELLDPPTPA